MLQHLSEEINVLKIIFIASYLSITSNAKMKTKISEIYFFLSLEIKQMFGLKKNNFNNWYG